MSTPTLTAFLAGVCSLALASCTPPLGPNTPNSQSWTSDTWKPQTIVSQKTYTEEERWALRANLLKQNEPTNSPAPEVRLIRWTEGPADHWETVAQCLTERGFPAKAEFRGVTYPNGGIPPEQKNAQEVAWYTCQAEYSLDPRFYDEYNEEQLALLYEYFEQYYIPCMKAHNQPVNEKDKPTRDVYIATFNDPDTDPWWPYPRDTAVPDNVSKACPDLPPDKALYGG